MNSSNSQDERSDADITLDLAFRRRRQQFADRIEPTDPASGTARISARLAQARANALTTPRPPDETIDLT